jgi:hypothetical protein
MVRVLFRNSSQGIREQFSKNLISYVLDNFPDIDRILDIRVPFTRHIDRSKCRRYFSEFMFSKKNESEIYKEFKKTAKIRMGKRKVTPGYFWIRKNLKCYSGNLTN